MNSKTKKAIKEMSYISITIIIASIFFILIEKFMGFLFGTFGLIIFWIVVIIICFFFGVKMLKGEK